MNTLSAPFVNTYMCKYKVILFREHRENFKLCMKTVVFKGNFYFTLISFWYTTINKNIT